MIVNSGRLLRTVVDDVLDYSKLESGNVDIVLSKTNLQNTLETVIRLIGTKCMEKRLVLKTSYNPSIEQMLTTDSRRLQQVLFNLLGNSVKFSNAGGVIEFDLTFDRPDILGYPSNSYSPKKCQIRGTALRLSVKDYGKGIAHDALTTIFNPFQQASADVETL